MPIYTVTNDNTSPRTVHGANGRPKAIPPGGKGTPVDLSEEMAARLIRRGDLHLTLGYEAAAPTPAEAAAGGLPDPRLAGQRQSPLGQPARPASPPRGPVTPPPGGKPADGGDEADHDDDEQPRRGPAERHDTADVPRYATPEQLVDAVESRQIPYADFVASARLMLGDKFPKGQHPKKSEIVAALGIGTK